MAEADPARRFVWAETSFFVRWYDDQPAAVQQARACAALRSPRMADRAPAASPPAQRVAAVVASGQLEFVGGGWVQHDEANPSLEAVVDQVCTICVPVAVDGAEARVTRAADGGPRGPVAPVRRAPSYCVAGLRNSHVTPGGAATPPYVRLTRSGTPR